MHYHLAIIAFAMLLYCLFSARLGRAGVTMPMVFLGFGVVFGGTLPPLSHVTATIFHDLAEITLALLLFADATALRRSALNGIGGRTARMLLLGLPFAIVIGTALNLLLLPDWPFWEACLLAALLAPTDAALGQSIQSNARVPQAFRDAMNAESGLNDGLALPFVIFFAGLAVGEADGGIGEGAFLSLLATQIGLGALVGIVGGFLIGKLRNFAIAREMMEHGLAQVATLFLVALIFLAAETFGGNAFVAVFVAGIVFANVAEGSVRHARDFLEGDGQFLAMLSFFFIGALFLPEALRFLTWGGLGVVLLSLTLVRPLAIWLSLMGTRTGATERLFYGWFGPRGLATALFAVFVVMDFEGVRMAGSILSIAITAVLVSAFAHGITARFAQDIFHFPPTAPPDADPEATDDPDGPARKEPS